MPIKLFANSLKAYKCGTIKINKLTLFYSYSTIIAFKYEGYKVRKENTWGINTDRHMNNLGCKEFKILPTHSFDKILNKIIKDGL